MKICLKKSVFNDNLFISKRIQLKKIEFVFVLKIILVLLSSLLRYIINQSQNDSRNANFKSYIIYSYELSSIRKGSYD